MRPATVKAFMAKIASHCLQMVQYHKAAMDTDGSLDHQSMVEAYTDLGEHCIAMCKALEADGLEKRGDELQPTRISAVTPDVPTGVRPVFRIGQREFGDAPLVAQAFERITKIDE
jgi:hypothetical protein